VGGVMSRHLYCSFYLLINGEKCNSVRLLADKAVQRIRRIFLMQRIPKAINKKRLVRYKEGAEMYSMGMNKFQSLAKDAGAILKIDRMVLVDLDVFDQYLESFRVK